MKARHGRRLPTAWSPPSLHHLLHIARRRTPAAAAGAVQTKNIATQLRGRLHPQRLNQAAHSAAPDPTPATYTAIYKKSPRLFYDNLGTYGPIY